MSSKYDLFISYAHLDDRSPYSEKNDWIDLLHERLSGMASQALGYEVSIRRKATICKAMTLVNIIQRTALRLGRMERCRGLDHKNWEALGTSLICDQQRGQADRSGRNPGDSA
jgi:hypothetical protein